MLKQKIGELDHQLRLSKENLDTYISSHVEVDNIKDILPKIAGDTINNDLEGIEYDAEQEELGAAAANGGNGFVENHYGKLVFYIDSPEEIKQSKIDLKVEL